MKRERVTAQQLDALSGDTDLIRQIQKSREDRQEGRVYDLSANWCILMGIICRIEDFPVGLWNMTCHEFFDVKLGDFMRRI